MFLDIIVKVIKASPIKFFEKKNSNYFFLEKMLNFISSTCVDEYKNDGSGRW